MNPSFGWQNRPLAFPSFKLKLHVVNAVSWGGVSFRIFCLLQFGAENIVIRVVGRILNDNLFSVVGDLEDDELDFAPAQPQLVVGRDTFRVYGHTVLIAVDNISKCTSTK